MKKICVFTTCSNKGYQKFGKRFFEEIFEYLPSEVHIHAFHDNWLPEAEHENLFYHDIADVARHTRFVQKHIDDPSKCGVVEKDGRPIKYYRYDAVSYSAVVYPLQVLAKMKEYDWIIRLDPDQRFIKKMPLEDLESFLEDEYTAIYLGRKDWPHSETGFVAYNLNKDGDKFINRMVETYDDGNIFSLEGYTDCDVFDHIRHGFEEKGYKFKNISEGVSGMHVWPQTWLGEYMEHLKGPAAKDGVDGLNELPTTLVGQAVHSVASFKPRTIVDIGVLDGSRGVSMARASLWSQTKKPVKDNAIAVHLWALDPFGDSEGKALDAYENFAQEDERFTYTYINKKKDSEKWEPELQIEHATLGRLEIGKSDFAYVDGEHTKHALRRDLLHMLPHCKFVMTPTYFMKDDKDKCQDIDFFGCNNIVEAMPHKILPAKAVCEDGGIVKAAVFGPAITPGFGKVQTRNAVEDEVIHKNIGYSIQHDPFYIEFELEQLRGKATEVKKRRKVPFVRQCGIHTHTAFIIAGGPSVSNEKHKDYKKNWQKIKKVMEREDVRTFVVKTTHDHMIYERKIIPYACVLLDPRGHVKDFVENPHPDVIYYVASMCDKSTWDVMLEGAPKLFGYNAAVKAGELEYVNSVLKFKKAVFFGGGSSSATRGIGLCHGMGFRKFIFAGFDQCYCPEIEDIDMEEKDVNGRPKYVKINVDGKEYVTAPILLAACQDVETSLREHNDLEFEAITEGMVKQVLAKVIRPKQDFFEIYDNREIDNVTTIQVAK